MHTRLFPPNGLPITLSCLLLFMTGNEAVYALSDVYVQDWESGPGGWFSKYGPGDPVMLVEDPLAPSPTTVQQITTVDQAGQYFSPLIPLQGGNTYCVATWIRWPSGGWPFLGIDNFDANETLLGENWLIGQKGYPTGYGSDDVVTPVPPDTLDWGLYRKTITLRADATSVRLKNELWFGAGKGGDDLGFFDDLAISDGECPCEVSVQVRSDVQAPGATLPVRVHIAHHRIETVTVTWELSVIDAGRRLIAKRTAPPHTFASGDVIDRDLGVPLPQDLAPGVYTLRLAISGMARTRGATTTFRVVQAE